MQIATGMKHCGRNKNDAQLEFFQAIIKGEY